jgi:hypothetical protein
MGAGRLGMRARGEVGPFATIQYRRLAAALNRGIKVVRASCGRRLAAPRLL